MPLELPLRPSGLLSRRPLLDWVAPVQQCTATRFLRDASGDLPTTERQAPSCTSPLTAALLATTPSVYDPTAFRYNRSSGTSRLSDGQNTRGEECHVLCNCTANTRYCDLGEYFQRHANRYLLNRRKITSAQKQVTSIVRMRHLRRPFCLLQC